jgi:FkbM family methyltransferase
MESLLRKLIPVFRLYNQAWLVRLYEKWALLRYAKKFNEAVHFRGIDVVVGRDATLFPSVYLQTYEKAELDLLTHFPFSPGTVFWDVGANIGLYSIIFGKMFPDWQIVAFEPNRNLHDRLRANIDRNGLENILIVPVALSNIKAVGKVDYLEEKPGAGRILIDSSQKLDPSNAVEIMTGNDFLLEHEDLLPNFIKIDVEGHEIEVINGMMGVIEKQRPLIALEVFANLWEVSRHKFWIENINQLFSIYLRAILVSEGSCQEITELKSDLLTGGLQTLIFISDRDSDVPQQSNDNQ